MELFTLKIDNIYLYEYMGTNRAEVLAKYKVKHHIKWNENWEQMLEKNNVKLIKIKLQEIIFKEYKMGKSKNQITVYIRDNNLHLLQDIKISDFVNWCLKEKKGEYLKQIKKNVDND